MIYVVEIPETNSLISFEGADVWCVNNEKQVAQAASLRVFGRSGAFNSFEDAVAGLHAGDGIEKVLVFKTEADAESALIQPNLWEGEGDDVNEAVNKFVHFLNSRELHEDARRKLEFQLGVTKNPPKPVYVDEDGNAFFG
jgi:hypothetical protein